MTETINQFKKTYADCGYPVVIYDEDFNLLWANEVSYSENSVFRPEKEKALSALDLSQVKAILKERQFARFGLTPVLAIGGDVTFAKLSEGCYAAWFLRGSVSVSGLYTPFGLGSAEIIAGAMRSYISEISLASDSVEANIASDNPEIEGQFQNIRRSSYKILRNIQNVEWISRFYREGECLHKKHGDVAALVKALCKSVGDVVIPNIPITLSLPQEPLLASIDVGFFEKAFLNILLNSMKYTRDGNNIAVFVSSAGSKVSITIRDSGSGITRENLIDVCAPFFSSEPAGDSTYRPGMGLGLTTASLFCEAHGGSLLVHSEYGKGTTVLMSFDKGEAAESEFKSSVSKYITNKFSPVYVEFCELCSLPQ